MRLQPHAAVGAAHPRTVGHLQRRCSQHVHAAAGRAQVACARQAHTIGRDHAQVTTRAVHTGAQADVGHAGFCRLCGLQQHVATGLHVAVAGHTAQPAVCGLQHHIGARHHIALALRSQGRAHARGRHPLHRHAHRVQAQRVVLDHINAAAARARAQAAHRGLQVVAAAAHRCASVEQQGRRSDVDIADIGVLHAAGRGGNAHRAVFQLDAAHRHIGAGQQPRSRGRAGAHNGAGRALGDGAAVRLHVHAAAARRSAGGAKVGRAVQVHAAGGQQAEVATGADDVGVGRDVSARAQGFDAHVAAAVGADRHPVGGGRAVVEGDVARRGAQHHGSIASGGADVAPGTGHGGRGAFAVEPVDGNGHVADEQRVGFEHEDAAAARTGSQGADVGFKGIAAAAGPAAGADLQVQTEGSHVGGAVAVDDGGAGDERHAAAAAHSAQRERAARFDANVTGGTERAFAAHTAAFAGHGDGAAGLQVDGATDACEPAMCAEHQVRTSTQTHRAFDGVHAIGHRRVHRQVATAGRQGLHRHQGGVAGIELLGTQQRERPSCLGLDQADGAGGAVVAQAGGVDFRGEQIYSCLGPYR